MKPEKKKAEMPQVDGRPYTEAERLQLKKYIEENVTVTVEKMPTLKCPRCYVYDGIDDNFMKICDRCCRELLDGAETLVEMGRLTKEEADGMVKGIRDAQLAQLQKYQRS